MERRAIVETIFEDGWGAERFDSIETALAEFRFNVAGTARTMTVDDLRSVVRSWRVGFPDLRFEIHLVVETGPDIAVHATLHGRQLGIWRDVPPTGRRIEVEHVFVFRFVDDRVTEVWEVLDREALERQLTDRTT